MGKGETLTAVHWNINYLKHFEQRYHLCIDKNIEIVIDKYFAKYDIKGMSNVEK